MRSGCTTDTFSMYIPARPLIFFFYYIYKTFAIYEPIDLIASLTIECIVCIHWGYIIICRARRIAELFGPPQLSTEDAFYMQLFISYYIPSLFHPLHSLSLSCYTARCVAIVTLILSSSYKIFHFLILCSAEILFKYASTRGYMHSFFLLLYLPVKPQKAFACYYMHQCYKVETTNQIHRRGSAIIYTVFCNELCNFKRT